MRCLRIEPHRTCPHDSGKVFPLPTDFGQSVSGFAGRCGRHIYPGLTSARVNAKFGSSACSLPGAVRTISLSLSLYLVPILANWFGLCSPLRCWIGWALAPQAVSVCLAGLSAPAATRGNTLDNANREHMSTTGQVQRRSRATYLLTHNIVIFNKQNQN